MARNYLQAISSSSIGVPAAVIAVIDRGGSIVIARSIAVGVGSDGGRNGRSRDRRTTHEHATATQTARFRRDRHRRRERRNGRNHQNDLLHGISLLSIARRSWLLLDQWFSPPDPNTIECRRPVMCSESHTAARLRTSLRPPT